LGDREIGGGDSDKRVVEKGEGRSREKGKNDRWSSAFGGDFWDAAQKESERGYVEVRLTVDGG